VCQKPRPDLPQHGAATVKVSTVLAIIFGPLIVGALLPMVFGKALRSTVSESMVCESVGAAAKRGYIDAAAKKKLYDEAIKTPNLDPKTRVVFEGARKDC
jgi:hypothetical protein